MQLYLFIEKYGNRDYSLTIYGVTPDFDAEFTVVAKNGVGEARSSAQLIVESAEGMIDAAVKVITSKSQTYRLIVFED